MIITYLAITVAIVLATVVVFALLSWGRPSEETQIDAPEPPLMAAAPAPSERSKRGDAAAGKARRKTS